jgi:hypothetical protein
VLRFTLIVAFPVPNVPLERPHHSAASVTRAGKVQLPGMIVEPIATANEPINRTQASAKATRTGSPLSQPISKPSEHQRRRNSAWQHGRR